MANDPGGEAAIERRLALTLACFYLLTLGGHHYSVDGIITFEAAKAIVFKGTLTLDPPVVWGEVVRSSSPYGVGASLMYAPLLLLWSPIFIAFPALQAVPFDPAVPRNPALYANVPYLLCSLLNPLLTIATACVVRRLARRVGLTRGWAVVAALCLGLASPAAAYARFDFSQPLVALSLTAALLLVLRPAPLAGRALLGAGAWLGVGVATRPEAVVFAFALVALAAGSGGSVSARGGLGLLVPSALALALNLLLTWLRVGAVFDPAYHSPADFTLAPRALGEGALGLLVSPGHGLLWFLPLCALFVPGVRALRVGGPEAQRLATISASLLALGLLLYGSFRCWWGGWCWGPRFLVPFVPLVILAAVAWAAAGGRDRRRVFVGLALLGALAALNGVLLDFVEFYRGLSREGLDPEQAHFSWRATPLLRGWSALGGADLDLLLLRVADRAQVERFSALLGLAPDGVLAAAARVSGPALVLALLAGVVRGLLRLRELTRSTPDPT